MNRFLTTNVKRLPKSLDWRERRAVTPVITQGSHPTCWIMAALGAIESAHYIRWGILLNLSHQQMMNHFDPFYVYDIGGKSEFVFDYAKKKPIYTIDAFQNGIRNRNEMIKIKDYKVIKSNRYDEMPLIQALNIGPVVVSIAAGGEFNKFAKYKGGYIFDGPYGDYRNHSMLAVGYDEECIICKNSFGKAWGEEGYIRIARNSNKFMKSGGIFEKISYPIL